jgi:hypothetical protein
MVGHHGDLRGGLQPLQDAAAVINSVAPVDWCNLATVSRSSYWHRRSGTTMIVRLFSRRVDLAVDPGVHTIVVEPVPGSTSEGERVKVELDADTKAPVGQMFRQSGLTVSGGGSRLTVAYEEARRSPVPTPTTTAAVLARRYACEIRDRLAPMVRRLAG